MCKFLSALVLRNGDIVCQPKVTDEHELLIADCGLRDEGLIADRAFVRVEYSSPAGAPLTDLDNYALIVDEPSIPHWFDDAMRERVTEQLRDRVKRMIVTDERQILLGGCWILSEGAVVEWAVGARIAAMYGNATVTNVSGNATVTNVSGNATVTDVRGNATVTR